MARLRHWRRGRDIPLAVQADKDRPTWTILEAQGRAAETIPISRMRREMTAAAELAFALGEDAHDYAATLESRMVDLSDVASLRDLLGATRAMILRVETAERLIRKCGDEIDALRRSMGVATEGASRPAA